MAKFRELLFYFVELRLDKIPDYLPKHAGSITS